MLLHGRKPSIPSAEPEWSEAMRTVGELAQGALSSFQAIRLSQGLARSPEGAGANAIEFVKFCLALAVKFPEESRRAFERLLPLTRLEIELVRRTDMDLEEVGDCILARLVEWANRSPIIVDDGTVNAADFLVHLAPHLDRLIDRQAATTTAMTLKEFERQ